MIFLGEKGLSKIFEKNLRERAYSTGITALNILLSSNACKRQPRYVDKYRLTSENTFLNIKIILYCNVFKDKI